MQGVFLKTLLFQKHIFLSYKKHFQTCLPSQLNKRVLSKFQQHELIEQCGWKGKRLGDIGVYEKQALILVNYHAGSGAAVLELARNIQKSVHEKFSVQLVPEVWVC